MASRLLTATVPDPGFSKRILFLNAELALALRQPELASKYADKLQSLVDSKCHFSFYFKIFLSQLNAAHLRKDTRNVKVLSYRFSTLNKNMVDVIARIMKENVVPR